MSMIQDSQIQYDSLFRLCSALLMFAADMAVCGKPAEGASAVRRFPVLLPKIGR